MEQGRWVSYIYRYRDNVRCENAGFIKIQRVNRNNDSKGRIQLGVRLYKERPCQCDVYLLYNGKKISRLTDIYIKARERDVVVKRVEIPWENAMGEGYSLAEYDGVLLFCDDGEILAGMWRDYEPDFGGVDEENYENNTPENISGTIEDSFADTMYDLEKNSKTALTEKNQVLKSSIDDVIEEKEVAAAEQQYSCQCMEEPFFEKEQGMSGDMPKSDSWDDIWDTYPKLPLFIDSPFEECIKIVPQDIGRLPMSNWKLGTNSFLTHSYYRYKYLMIGKLKQPQGVKLVIGVPGVFTNKERYLANMFGFSVFVPVKKADISMGKFGYWIWEISRQ